MKMLEFADRLVTYEDFTNDLAARITNMIETDRVDPEFISQRTAFKIFGRRNVERWRREGKIIPYKRPGKVEYRTSDLRLLQRTVQDYFNQKPKNTDNNDRE